MAVDRRDEVGSARRDAAALFAGPGEVRRLCRAFDWEATPLGAVATWPPSLQTVVELTLASRFPMSVLWGPDLVQIYNEAYLPLLRDKHPSSVGQPTHQCWPEIRHITTPTYEAVLRGESLYFEDALYPIRRRVAGDDTLEDAWFTLSHTPVRDEAGTVAGISVIVVETTREVERRSLQADVLAQENALQTMAGRLIERTFEAEDAEKAALAERARATSILHAMSDAHVTLDAAFTLLTANPAAERAMKMSSADLLGRTIWEVFPTSVDTDSGRAYRRVVAEGIEAHLTQHYVGEGRDVHLEIDAYPALEGGVAIFWRDVSERARAAADVSRLLEEAQQARAEAEAARQRADAANRTKGEFMAVISHELRTPLSAIGGYAELMELGIRGPVTDQQREDLHRIQLSQRHVLSLVSQVLDFARIETGGVRYELVQFAVADAFASAEVHVLPQIRAGKLTLILDARDPLLKLFADREKVQQILINLLSNSIKFTEAGGELRLTCVSLDETVAISLSDTGGGIPADKLETVFQPFVQVHGRYSGANKGVGLGLAISRDLARGMGGNLTAESTPGTGSVFTLTLPRSR